MRTTTHGLAIGTKVRVTGAPRRHARGIRHAHLLQSLGRGEGGRIEAPVQGAAIVRQGDGHGHEFIFCSHDAESQPESSARVRVLEIACPVLPGKSRHGMMESAGSVRSSAGL